MSYLTPGIGWRSLYTLLLTHIGKNHVDDGDEQPHQVDDASSSQPYRDEDGDELGEPEIRK